ncbi:hypothetical protein AB0N17_46655 [Streptomyces sp. NPDC051133]|uniref:hypothetical protein n=1 Tax=Streptomyces sp. NPDC051133 TaxID=3155521 RepID=UPI003444D7A0
MLNLPAASGRELVEDRLEAVEGVVIDLREEGVLVPGELVRGSDVVEVPGVVLALPGDPDALEDREGRSSSLMVTSVALL